MADETRIPAKQLEHQGTYAELLENLIEQEAGWCTEDDTLYGKSGGELKPLSKIATLDYNSPREKIIDCLAHKVIPVIVSGSDSDKKYLYPASIGSGGIVFGSIYNDNYYWAACAIDGTWTEGSAPIGDRYGEGAAISIIDGLISVKYGDDFEIDSIGQLVAKSATTSRAGIVQLNNAIDSDSTSTAATSKAVKDAYDALNSKIVARAVFMSQEEWATQSQLPGDPAKVYYVATGTGEDAYTVYVWKSSTSEYVEVDESSISLEGYWHGSPGTSGNGNVVTDVTLGNDGVPVLQKDFTALSDTGDGKNVTVTFTEAQSRTDIATGDTLATLFGKIKKWLTDLKTVAFTGSYDDLIDKPTIPAAQVQSDWNQIDNEQPDYIKNKPTIPVIPGVFSTSENGLVPAASGTGDTGKFLKGDGSWSQPIPAATQDSVWSHLNGSDLWAPVTFGDYEIPMSLSPDIPDAYKNLYQQVEYIWSNDGGLININGLSFKSTDKFVVNIYAKDLQDQFCDLVAASETQNHSGATGFKLEIDPVYYPGQCSYWIEFGSTRTQKVINYKSGTTNPTLEELPRRQKIVAHAPYLIMNGTTLLNNVPSSLKNLTSIRYVGINSGLARLFAFGIMEVRDDNDNLLVKLVPCLNKSTGKYGVFCVQTSQFCGASSGTVQEYVPPVG